MDFSIAMGSDRRKKQFTASIVIAFMLHMVLVAIWKTVPSPTVQDVPVKMLSVKLGNSLSGQERMLVEKANAPLKNVDAIEKMIQTNVESPMVEGEGEQGAQRLIEVGSAKEKSKSSSKAVVKSKKSTKGQVAKRFVRERVVKVQEAQAAGEALGNKEQSDQQRVAGYTQTISLWLNKFKVYPSQARDAGMEGQAIVRIRIDRRGNIHYRILTQRTPYPMLDKAALDMVRRANPVPPVPAGYPDKTAYLEFLIPVNFSLD